MIFVKTQAGQKALKERHGALSPRQRSAFILFEGRRPLALVLAAPAALGITQDGAAGQGARGAGAGR